MKKFIIIFAIAVLAISVHADTVNPKDNSFSYLFHLYYDNGQLNADRDFQFKYDIIAAPYVQAVLTTQFPYRGDVINLSGEVADHFVFDPKQGDTKFVKGKISVKAPYVADGQKVVFYDNQNQPVLTIPVSESSFCNDDGICNSDKGEDYLSCPKDCKQSLPAPPPTTSATTPTGSSGLLSSIIYVVIGVLLVGVVWWIFKRRRDKNSFSPVLPPPPPPTPPVGPSLPTPPSPPSANNPV